MVIVVKSRVLSKIAMSVSDSKFTTQTRRYSQLV